MDPELDDAPDLSKYFKITDAGDEWHLDCLKCWKEFSILKADHRLTNRQALLRHAASHQTSAEEEVDSDYRD